MILRSNERSDITHARCYSDPCICVCIYIYIYASLSFPNRVHREFMTLISFFLEGLILEGKLILLLKFLLLFRCVFEAIFKVKVNLGFHKLFCIK
jgi:hypothetical protein